MVLPRRAPPPKPLDLAISLDEEGYEKLCVEKRGKVQTSLGEPPSTAKSPDSGQPAPVLPQPPGAESLSLCLLFATVLAVGEKLKEEEKDGKTELEVCKSDLIVDLMGQAQLEHLIWSQQVLQEEWLRSCLLNIILQVYSHVNGLGKAF